VAISFKTRQLYADELRILKTLKTKKEKEVKKKPKYHYYPIMALLGAGFAYLASVINIGFFQFLFGTIAVILVCGLVFLPYELYKARKRLKKLVSDLDLFIEVGTVATSVITATRIALAEEKEDEGELYIIEYAPGNVLYLWDSDYNFRKKFPCLHFEIYENRFFKMTGRLIYPRSERIQPVIISKEAKWKYIGIKGFTDQQT
jgi:hypothetical protein